MTLIHIFPGQGSHRPGMGQGLFSAYPHLVRQADAVLGYSIEDLCLNGPAERLSDTRYTQCAVYVVGALSYVESLRAGDLPGLVAGHSLGEYVALFAAGAFDFATGLEIVATRAALMADAGPGAMLAVLGLPVDRIRDILTEPDHRDVDLANLNSPEQTVISGPSAGIERIGPRLAAEARAVIPLKVSGAFHSRYMAPAAARFAEFLGGYRFATLRIPVIANATAGPYEDTGVAQLLVQQISQPVRWTETVERLLAMPEPVIDEIGPGRVLTGLVSQIRQHRSAAAPSPS